MEGGIRPVGLMFACVLAEGIGATTSFLCILSLREHNLKKIFSTVQTSLYSIFSLLGETIPCHETPFLLRVASEWKSTGDVVIQKKRNDHNFLPHSVNLCPQLHTMVKAGNPKFCPLAKWLSPSVSLANSQHPDPGRRDLMHML